LSAEQLRRFEDEGYLIVDDLIDVEQFLDPMVADFAERLDKLVRKLYREGQLSSTYDSWPFGDRLTQVYAETGKSWSQHFDFSLPLRRHIDPEEPCFFPPSVFRVLRNQGILDVVESLIGPEIYSTPVQHVRLKPPERVVEGFVESDRGRGAIFASPWHQDASVVIEEADETEMITVWIPVFDATEANGCLQLVPRNHREGLFEHCPAPAGKYLSTKFFDYERAIPVPMKRGSALFMTRMTPHGSLSNTSDEMRWSMDLRYSRTGEPTGRPEFPGFVARSRCSPQSELLDPAVWQQNWMQTRERLAAQDFFSGEFARSWSGNGCA
jgi:ectoine hydroxylase-related dioxygenase (phytanoyl-CoA dioxygenase family)